MEVQTKRVSCIGFILDGNRRWARERGLPTMEGHRKGYGKLKDVLSWCDEKDIPHVVAYVFSTENWNRSPDEVTYLMDLIRTILIDDLSTIREEGVAIHIVGDVSRFSRDIQDAITDMHESNPNNATRHVWLAASYGGRAEIIAGVNKVLVKGVSEVGEDDFAEMLWTHDMPDPDIIVRTGGEKRLSNFLTWSGVYSELFFLDTYWPAFSKKEFDEVLEAYAERERRHGK